MAPPRRRAGEETTMPIAVAFNSVLADAEGIGAAIVILITIVGWIANLVSNKNQKGPPVANRPRPPARPRDGRLQQEINVFIEEVGGQRSRQTPPRPAVPASRPAGGTARNPQPEKNRPATAPGPRQPARRPRPGEEIATRHAPVTESLGTGVKQHLSQHMADRVTQDVQQRLAPRVEEKVAQDLGVALNTGSAPSTTSALPAARAERFAEMLRTRSGMQQAIVMNLILSPPVSQTRASRR
jgi:hypothetical protein